MVAATVLLSASNGHIGLLRLALDAARSREESILVQSLIHNWIRVGDSVAPLFDIVGILSALIGLVSLLALTRGQTLEKFVRPLAIGAIGATAGSFVALALIATGLGGYATNRVYAATFGETVPTGTVIDGDTFRMGEMTLRLAGIDAPEFHGGSEDPRTQRCRDANDLPFPCGMQARDRLEQLLVNRAIICEKPAWETRRQSDSPLREAFGRPLVQCHTYDLDGTTSDVASELTAGGYADIYRDKDGPLTPLSYLQNVACARRNHSGMWSGATLTPRQWRNDRALARRFLAGDPTATTQNLAPDPNECSTE
ncbi:MAG: thermonuclease family protein [Terricaulis sp.]